MTTLADRLSPADRRELDEVMAGLHDITKRLRWEERDVFLAKLTPDTAVTIRTAGPFGPVEIERLIRLLMMQQEMLTQPTEETPR